MSCTSMRRAAWLLGILISCSVSAMQAGVIAVSQESAPGVGDFDANPLGFIDSFSFAGSAADFYDYGGFSYNNVDPPATPNTLQYFFADTTDGLAFFQVVDAPGDG